MADETKDPMREALVSLVEWATGRDVHGRNERPETCGYCDALARARAALAPSPSTTPETRGDDEGSNP